MNFSGGYAKQSHPWCASFASGILEMNSVSTKKKTATNVALKQKIKWTALLTNYYPSGSATFSSSALAVVPIV